MSNHYFRFKEFTVHQERCAMKVSTDACIQGAWAPVAPSVKKALDIGCGTGLLSLMIAQRNPDMMIDALEADASAAHQAMENVAASLWNDRIRVLHKDARDHTAPEKYDMIICNPPFFSNDLQAQDDSRNRARHDVSLSQAELFTILSRHLGEKGMACIMLPVTEHALWETLLAREGWHIHQALSVCPSERKCINRIISVAAAFPCTVRKDETLTIYDTTGGYTEHFRRLMEPYYLYL